MTASVNSKAPLPVQGCRAWRIWSVAAPLDPISLPQNGSLRLNSSAITVMRSSVAFNGGRTPAQAQPDRHPYLDGTPASREHRSVAWQGSLGCLAHVGHGPVRGVTVWRLLLDSDNTRWSSSPSHAHDRPAVHRSLLSLVTVAHLS